MSSEGLISIANLLLSGVLVGVSTFDIIKHYIKGE